MASIDIKPNSQIIMRASFFKLILLLPITFLGSCSLLNHDDDKPLHPKLIELTPLQTTLIQHNNEFGVDLFKQVASQENSNVMLSPLSANVALTMLLNGTDTNTKSQIMEMLGYATDSDLSEINAAYQSLLESLLDVDPTTKLSIANAMFHENDFVVKQSYLDILKNDFDTQIRGLDFKDPQTVDVINNWAASQTNQKIKKVINNIDPELVMFLMNAVYFDGQWSTKFDESKTSDGAFYVNGFPMGYDDASEDEAPYVNVDMMKGKINSLLKFTSEYKMIEIPYGRKNFSMVIIVPLKPMEEFLEDFDSSIWSSFEVLPNGDSDWNEINVVIPKFSFSYEKYLNGILQNLGMEDAFNPNMADLSGISDQDLFVSFVKQNSFIEVDESGTEAAAVTTIGIGVTSAPSELVFHVDSPFVFLIRERTTNTVLFMGKVLNPNE